MTRARWLLVADTRHGGAAEAARWGEAAGAVVEHAETVEAARARLAREAFDGLIALDAPPALDALALVEAAHALDAELPVVVVAASGAVERAAAAVRLRAFDFLVWPVADAELRAAAERLRAQARVPQANPASAGEPPAVFEDIIGTCPAMQRVFERIDQVAEAGIDCLIVGETGTGKERVARAIHRRSRRAEKPFVPVDCGAIPDALLESEFFGHERGAFTGAESRSAGLLEFADGGTFFLDELGELPLLMQAKLLRTLQERRIRRVGGRTEIPIDVRVVAATARDLEAMTREGQFRRDLLYRINVVRIDLPPLRDRGDDLGLLAEHFATRYSREMEKPLMGLTPEAYQVLRGYRWPGNVRELQNVVRRAIALSTDSMIGLDDLPDELVIQAGEAAGDAGSEGYFALRDRHLKRFEVQYLTDLLARHRGDVKTAAVEARLPRGTLYRLLKNHGLDGSQFRGPGPAVG